MSFAFTFTPQASGMNASQYNECIRKLEEVSVRRLFFRSYPIIFRVFIFFILSALKLIIFLVLGFVFLYLHHE